MLHQNVQQAIDPLAASHRNGQAASRPPQFGSDCYLEDRSHALETPFTIPALSHICTCKDLKVQHVPRITTKELLVDDQHSAHVGSNGSDDVSRYSILDDKIIISFYRNDPDSPYNWSRVSTVLVI